MFLWTRRRQFWPTSQKHRSNSEKFKIYFCRKSSFGHANRRFDNPAESLSLNVQKWQKKVFFFQIKLLSSKFSSEHVEGSFDQPVKNFMLQFRKVYNIIRSHNAPLET